MHKIKLIIKIIYIKEQHKDKDRLVFYSKRIKRIILMESQTLYQVSKDKIKIIQETKQEISKKLELLQKNIKKVQAISYLTKIGLLLRHQNNKEFNKNMANLS